MKKCLIPFLLILSLRSFSQFDEDSRILNEFIILLKPAHSIDQVLKDIPALKLKKSLSAQMNIWLVERNTMSGAEEFLAVLKKNEAIKLAQFNHKIEQRSIVPNDTFFSKQWNLNNTGAGGSTPGADIDAIDAWGINHGNITANGDTIVIAIVDVSFDHSHQDLNFFVNNHEIPNNGVDDDGNGYVDDYEGWNAYNSNGNINSGGGTPHSMHISGIAGAIANNKIGIAGVCWGPKILRVCASSGTEATVVNGYDYVIAMRRLYNNTSGAKGAFIVSTNSSFGVDYGNPTDYPIWCAMYDSMGAVGILSAAATTNNYRDVDVLHDMPTQCPSNWLITVNNTSNMDHLYSSGTGSISLDIGAPGTNIYSTVTSNSYLYMTGTSMSSPHVTGTVAAMFAAACPRLLNDYNAHPDSVALALKEMILTGTTRLSDLYHQTVSGGRLNLYHAIKNLNEYNCNDCNFSVSTSFTQPSCSNTCDGTAQVNVTNSGQYSCQWSNGQNFANTIQNLCPGFYSVTVTDLASGCRQARNFSLFKPDSLLVSNIHTISARDSSPGNIIINASEGNYILQYSLDDSTYQSTPIFVVNGNGNYNVYIKSENGCLVQRNVSLTGINEIGFVTELQLYPNPANDALNISLDVSSNFHARFSILNTLGETLQTEEKDIASGVQNERINLSSLANGVYLLRLNASGSLFTRKFVVSK